MEPPLHGNNQHFLPPADLPGEIERLREALTEERDRHLRTLADFKNYRRRIERDGNTLAEEGKRGILLALLDTVDDIEKAMQWTHGTEHSVVKGLQMIHKKLLALLETQGVLPFESAGTIFNHDLHEAVAVAHPQGREAGTIVEEVRRGYFWNDVLLRPAQVQVAG